MTRIGVAVAGDVVSVVLVNGQLVEWRTTALVGESGVRGAVESALSRLPRLQWPRPSVWLTIDDPRSHPKTVRGLPPITDARALGRVIEASPLRFFVSSNGALATTGVRVIEPGVVTAAAFPMCVLDAVGKASDSAKLRIAAVVPASIAKATLTEDERTEADGIAVGATRVDRREVLVYRPKRRRSPEGSLARRWLLGLGGAMICAIVAIGPTWRANRIERDARARIASTAKPRAKALATVQALDRVARSLSAVTGFESSRTSVTLLLAQLNGALPPGSAITTLKIDTSAVTLVAITPRAADVVHAIEEIPGVVRSELVGPVTREIIRSPSTNGHPQSTSGDTGLELERVTVRFRLVLDSTTARRPLVAPDSETAQ